MAKKRRKHKPAPVEALPELTVIEHSPSRVNIEVGGHSVSVEAQGSLNYVSSVALDLFRNTADDAKKLPFGFDATNGEFERAEPIREPGSLEPDEWEEARHARLGRIQPPLDAAA